MRTAHKLLVLGGNILTYYVDTATGNDSNTAAQAQNNATPWKTIDKALATVPITGNLQILVKPGTYAENSGATNYLLINRAFTQRVSIKPWGVGTVLVTDNGSGTYCVRFQDGRNVEFQNVTIDQAAANTQATVRLDNTSTAFFTSCTINTRGVCVACALTNKTVNATFNACTLIRHAGATGDIQAFNCFCDVNGVCNLTLNNCTVTGQGTGIVNAAVKGGLTDGSGTFNLTITGGSYTDAGNYAINVTGGSLIIDGATISSTTTPACVFGTDGAGTWTTRGSIKNCTLTSGSSHCLLVGQLCSAVTVNNCTCNGGDYGLVMKNCTGTVVTNSVLIGGTQAGCYFKGANTSTVTNCDIRGTAHQALVAGVNGATKVSACSVTHCTITGSTSANCELWPDATEDAGGCILDFNHYVFTPGVTNIGTVRGTANIATLGALQAAWAAYDVPTNDANSTVN